MCTLQKTYHANQAVYQTETYPINPLFKTSSHDSFVLFCCVLLPIYGGKQTCMVSVNRFWGTI